MSHSRCTSSTCPSEWKEHPLNYLNQGMTVSKESVKHEYTRQEKRVKSKHAAYMDRAKEYSVYFYGSPAQKEERRREWREVLQSQIREIDDQRKRTFDVEGLSRAVQEGTNAKVEKELGKAKKYNYLKTIKDDNKTLMELKAQQRRADRLAQWEKEKELLKHNPINWSSTLK